MDADMNEPIIRDFSAFLAFGFVKLTNEAREVIADVAKTLQPHNQRQVSKVERCLECFLQLTDGSTLRDQNSWVAAKDELRDFLLALESPNFLSAKRNTRYAYVTAAARLILGITGASPLDNVDDNVRLNVHENLKEGRLNEKALKLWRAWPVTSRNGHRIWLPLYAVSETHGPETAALFHQVCDTYVSSRRIQKIPGAKELFGYVAGLSHFRFSDYKCANASREFFDLFYEAYKAARLKTCSAVTVLKDWARGFVPFAQSALIDTGLFVGPAGGFPGPDDASDAETNERLDKFILPVPPELGAYDALAYLREEVTGGVRVVVHWAQKEAQELYENAKRRRHSAKLGIPRLLPSDRGETLNPRTLVRRFNPNAHNNACATYERYTHLCRDDYESLQILFPDDLSRVSSDLGIPTAGSLLPHATLLVHEHPEIVPAFLETLEIWNEHEKRTGLIRQNRVTYLIGNKFRAGQVYGRKRVKLTRASLRLVLQILRITKNLRKYLKDKGDPSWRFLFLTSGKGFDHPAPVTKFSTFTSGASTNAELARKFMEAGAKSCAEASLIAQNFTLRTIRHTQAICVFLETHSEVEMAKALGHARRSKVLNSYLPKKLAGFLRLRWMRAFQTRMVVHMTRDTPHQLLASGLASRHALTVFLENHPFPDIKKLSAAYEESSSPPSNRNERNATFVINASVETLTLLTNIVRTVDEGRHPIAADGKYWASLSQHVIAYIKAHGLRQPSIIRALREAEENNRSLNLDAALYA